MKERPILFSGPMVRAILEGRKTQTRRVIPHQPSGREDLIRENFKSECKYGWPGDRLWVRETALISPENFVDEGLATHSKGRVVQYLATHPDREMAEDYGIKKATPSIFMPRWASRILLEITEVRVQRLCEISEADAKAEGIDWDDSNKNKFPDLWDSINAKRGHGWDKNPWVWALTFRKIKPQNN